eukprot:1175743-Prorocentrum_minimum.AAC.2
MCSPYGECTPCFVLKSRRNCALAIRRLPVERRANPHFPPPEALNLPPEALNLPPEALNLPPEDLNLPPEALGSPPGAVDPPPEASNAPPEALNTPPEPLNPPPEPIRGPAGDRVPLRHRRLAGLAELANASWPVRRWLPPGLRQLAPGKPSNESYDCSAWPYTNSGAPPPSRFQQRPLYTLALTLLEPHLHCFRLGRNE